jgi:hypothetical protein
MDAAVFIGDWSGHVIRRDGACGGGDDPATDSRLAATMKT